MKSLLARIVVSLCCVIAMFWGCSDALAAPQIYRFEAVVGELPPGNVDVGLPFEIIEGTLIGGILTIDSDLSGPPIGNSSSSVQPHKIEFQIEDFIFGTQGFQARVINDSGIIDGPNAGPADFVDLQCSTSAFLVGCSPTIVDLPTPSALGISIDIRLAGRGPLVLDPDNPGSVFLDTDIPLSQPRLPDDLSTWNAFDLERTLRFSFVDTSGNGALHTAAIGDFVQVPEPLGLTCCLCISGICSFNSRLMRRCRTA